MRYILFGGDFYYAQGGAHDVLTTSDTMPYLKEVVKSLGEYDWWHIYDTWENVIIAGSCGQAHGAPDIEI